MMKYRASLTLAALAFCSFAVADIGYKVSVAASGDQLQIEITAPVKGDVTAFQIPNWAPGAYNLSNYRDGILELKAVGEKGNELTVNHDDPNTWAVSSKGEKNVTVKYSVRTRPSGAAYHYSGPSTYLYVVGRKEEKCVLTIEPPKGGMIAVGLNETKPGSNTFTAKTYDVLADNPVTMGEFVMDTYTVHGKPHFIAYRGEATSDVDREYVKQRCKWISDMEGVFFHNSVPYDKYVWHFSVSDNPDGGGGLEHLASTQISMGAGAGRRVLDVYAHEFFHLWNVKRIRSKVLGPFDYLVLPKTGALWWLEGVTDYYAYVLPHRYGMTTTDQFLSDLMNNVSTARRTPGRNEISIYDSSLKVGEANNGRGNSNGLKISYYTFGWLAGMCLDIEIRSQTKGKKSLDDVEWALWQMCKDDKPGFEESAIRDLCVKIGGPELGPFYDKLITQIAGDMPIEAQLAKVGMEIKNVSDVYTDYGFRWMPVKARGGARITSISALAGDKLKEGDLVVGINGLSTAGVTTVQIDRAMNKALNSIKPGDTFKVKVRRDEADVEVELTAASGTRQVDKVVPKLDATPEMVKLREDWLRSSVLPGYKR